MGRSYKIRNKNYRNEVVLMSAEELEERNGHQSCAFHCCHDLNSLQDHKRYCMHCFECGPENTRTLTCSRCLVVRYCSKQCQKEDYKEHRVPCKRLEYFRKKEKELGDLLHNFPIEEDCCKCKERKVTCHVDIIRDAPGRFWTAPLPREYVQTLYEIMLCVEYLVHAHDMSPLTDMLIEYRLEMLRLDRHDNLKQRYKLPFDLLSQNRDMDCLGFLTYWLNMMFGKDREGMEPGFFRQLHSQKAQDKAGDDEKETDKDDDDGLQEFDIHKGTSRGEWIYPSVKDKLADPLAELALKRKEVPVGLLAALVLVKLRMIEAPNSHSHSTAEAPTACQTEETTDVETNISGLSLTDFDVADKQEEMVERYLRMIKKQNSVFLKAVCDPEVLEKLAQVAKEEVAEAKDILPHCREHFLAVRNMLPRLEKITGRKLKAKVSVLVACK